MANTFDPIRDCIDCVGLTMTHTTPPKFYIGVCDRHWDNRHKYLADHPDVFALPFDHEMFKQPWIYDAGFVNLGV